MQGIQIGINIGVTNTYNEVVSISPSANNLLQQDGVSFFLLQDGISKIILN